MANKIQLTPDELRAQAAEMESLRGEYESVFSSITEELTSVNANWSPNLANNFLGKITSAQNGFKSMTELLQTGAQIASNSATSYESIDAQLAGLARGNGGGVASGGVAGGGGGAWGDDVVEINGSLLDAIRQEFANLPEDIKTAGEALAWIEKEYGKAPDWLTHAVDVIVPSSLKDAYMITSGLIQGDLTLDEAWKVTKDILKGNTTLSTICGAIDYAIETGDARYAEMYDEAWERLTQGDILGTIGELGEGVIDTLGGGVIEGLAGLGGGLVDAAIDNIPIVKGLNMGAEYVTGLLGLNDGEGYSAGGLIGAVGKAASNGLDIVTDVASDGINAVTGAITDGVKSGVEWFKGLF